MCLGLPDPVLAANAAGEPDDGLDPLDISVAQQGQIPKSGDAAGVQLLFQGWANAVDQFQIIRRRDSTLSGLPGIYPG